MPRRNAIASESLTLSFGTIESSVDAEAVASTLRALVVLVKETEREIEAGSEVRVRVRPFDEGSLEVPLDVYIVGALTLFEFHPTISRIFSVIKDYVTIKTALRGEDPDEASDGTIDVGGIHIRGDNNVINIIKNSQVNTAVDRAFTDIEHDQEIRNLKLIRDATGEHIALIPRDEFSYFRSPDENRVNDGSDRVRRTRVILTIRSPVFEGKAKWKFNFQGASIAAEVRDEEFLAKVRARVERFAAGDRLDVDLEIGERFNEAIADFERNSRYAVVKVHQHIQQPRQRIQQPDLFEGDT